MLEHGWTFADGPGVPPDPAMGAPYLHQLYTRARPGMTGRVTVPLLWDTATDTIVRTESSEIIRMFNKAHDELGARPGHYHPDALDEEIDPGRRPVYVNVDEQDVQPPLAPPP